MPSSVFVSSTFADLARHRQLVRDAIAKLEYGSKAMEFFGALPDTPKEECLRLVRSANLYVGIFAMRYGFIDHASEKSLTQLEYEEAQAIRLPSLIYVMDEEAHPVFPKHVDTGPSAGKLQALKGVLKKNHVVNFFSSPEDLAAKVTQDLVRLFGTIAKQPTAQVLSQLAANAVKRHPLTAPRFDYLKERTAGMFKHNIPDAIFRESLELTIGGDNMAAAFVLSRGTPMPLDDAIDGLMEVGKLIAELIAQNNNQSTEPKDV
ncbi:MAG TPA: DUF4062 domain-containing protein [Methylophilaceae bacterium]|jgi:hypothetical protein